MAGASEPNDEAEMHEQGEQMQLTTRVRADLLTAGQQDVTPDSARGVLLAGHGHGSMGTTCCSATFTTEPAQRS